MMKDFLKLMPGAKPEIQDIQKTPSKITAKKDYTLAHNFQTTENQR